MINNSGLAFRMAGPTDSFAFLSDFSSLLSSALMLLGRLEFFVLLAILIPSFWKKTT
jgi:trk system potassium uptake protein TrkH